MVVLDPGPVEEHRQPVGGAETEVVGALGAHLQIAVEVLLVERLAAVRALDPHALRDTARLLRRSDGFGNALEPGHDNRRGDAASETGSGRPVRRQAKGTG